MRLSGRAEAVTFRLLAVLMATVGDVGATALSLPDDDPRVRTASSVLDAIVAVAGDSRTPPTLQIVPSVAAGTVRVAWFSTKKHTVYLEEEVVDLCLGVGADSLGALAVLIGHELAHFYQHHDWVGDFGNGFADLEAARRLQHNTRSRAFEYEVQADLFGGLYGYMAGYNTLGTAPQLLSAIYRVFELDEEMPGYPNLADRQEMARRAEARLAQLVPAFDAGRHLLVIGEHQLAAATFDFLARDFPSREILNNAGVAYARAALSRMSGSRTRFALPLEIDAETRLAYRSAGRKGDGADTHEEVAELLDEARRRLLRACSTDAGYAPARTNLACVYYLRGQIDEALSAAREALVAARGHDAAAADARIIEGICLADGDEAMAAARFTAALSGNEPLARLNLDALGGQNSDLRQPTRPAGDPEMVIGRGTETFDAILQAPETVVLAGLDSAFIDPILLHRRLGSQTGYLLDTGTSLISLVAAQGDHDGHTARGIGIGSAAGDVRSLYGVPTTRIESVDGAHWVYEPTRIAFHLDRDRRVRGWLLFDKSSADDATRAESPIYGPRVALVIGNDGYDEAPLRCPVNDAVGVGRALRRAGFEVFVETNLDRDSMAGAIARFGEALGQQGGVGLFYFSGHGVHVDNTNYLVPLKATIRHADDVEVEYIPLTLLGDLLERAGNSHSIVILDACRNVPFADATAALDGLASMELDGVFTAYATAAGQTAVDGGDGEHSVFAGALLRHLLTPGQSIGDLFEVVANEVLEATRGQQRPFTQDRLTESYVLVPEGADLLGVARRTYTPDLQGMVFVEEGRHHIDIHEVTNAEYASFLTTRGLRGSADAPWLDIEDQHARIRREGERFTATEGFEDHPVVEVTWHGAKAYCEWYRKRLPTAREWNLAATGSGRRRFPWGDDRSEPGSAPANFRTGMAGERPLTAPVDSHADGAAACGARNMAGNVWEWVADADGDLRLALGASWFNDPSWFGREQWIDAILANELTGFRCVRDR